MLSSLRNIQFGVKFLDRIFHFCYEKKGQHAISLFLSCLLHYCDAKIYFIMMTLGPHNKFLYFQHSESFDLIVFISSNAYSLFHDLLIF